MEGDVGVRGQTADVDQSFEDVFDLLKDHVDGMLQGQVFLRHGRWGLDFTSSWLRLEDESAPLAPAGGTAEVVTEMWQGQVDLWYRLGAKPLGCDPCAPCAPWVIYDVYAGARFMDIETELRAPAALREGSESWVDPVIGGRITYDFNRRVSADIQADIGGFGIASDLTWKLRLGVEWKPTRWFSLSTGWMWIDTDYESGSGADRVVWDVLQDGPYVSLGISL
jgi:hypothetical protein